MLKNLKIRGKLLLGFIMVLIVTAIIAVYGIISVMDMTNDVAYLMDYPTARYNTLSYARTDLVEMRRLNALMAFHSGETDELPGIFAQSQRVRENLRMYVDEYMHSVQTDPQMDPARAAELMAYANQLRSFNNRFMIEVLESMYTAAMADDRNRQLSLLDHGAYLYSHIDYYFNTLMDVASTTKDALYADMNANANQTITIMIAVAIIGLVAGIAIALFIARLVTKPINEVVAVLDNVSNGDFNINFRSDLSNDETGIMTQYVYNVINIIRGIVDDIGKFAHEANVNGDIEYRVDSTKYKGSYNEMVASLNGFTDGFVKDVMNLMDILASVNNGDFKASLAPLPGKKAVMNKSVDELMANLNGVNAEIGLMIEAAAERGDMHFQIDASKYKGGWNGVMAGLNKIAQAVDAPIVEIRDVMSYLSKGDFTNKVTGNYAGDFLQIKEAVNATIDALSGYISEIAESLTRVSGGDLTTSIRREYVGSFNAIKESINNISSSLNRTMSEISSASDQVLSGAKQISASAMDLANGASTQASSVEELNASVDLINHQTQANAQSAAEANSLSKLSTDNAREGNDAMKQTLDAMNQIKESSNNISKIIRTIQDIAFQTNLLALNAAVEAARAGEHGRGFAVVAEEVRSLAARSQTAASETTELIGSSITTVDTGSSIAQSTAESLDTIVENANKVLNIVNTISSASQEQAEAISQVGIGLQQVSQVVQANSAVSEEAAAAAEELNSQAEILQQLVGFFKL
ncbi:MAG: methyl-accepting chemotaxis protein [Defluviitaleaceae bacterium]|nr:methyl-accepting chemotaxis protein [Defluviitaleaceae bacterium]